MGRRRLNVSTGGSKSTLTTGRPENSSPAVLQVENVRKVYGGEVALADASLSVGTGEIHGLIGANGAGKSTLIKIVCGVETQDAGTVTICGETLPVPGDPRAVKAVGCAYIHQDRALAPDLSVAENIALTTDFPRRVGGRISWGKTRRKAATALSRMGVDIDPDSLVRDLPIAEQTLVAIARAIGVEARLVLLDEPTASLGLEESRKLYEVLEQLAADGVSSVLITHALGDALKVCDRITVLRDGRVVDTCDTDGLDAQTVNTMVLGHPLSEAGAGDRAPQSFGRADEAVMAARGLRGEVIGPLDFDLHRGEILGITGLIDCGHLELGQILAGLTQPRGGAVVLHGGEIRLGSVPASIAAGIGYVPSDRLDQGLGLGLTLRENLFLNPQGRGPINRRAESRRAKEILVRQGVKPPDPEAELSTLSGGNQQKVLLARWLERKPEILVLSEPTVGVDVGARDDIYAKVRVAVGEGMTVLLISSDIDEVVELADRVIVLSIGRKVGELSSGELDPGVLGHAINRT
jgi:ribose transport system ATP-binding protein